MGQVLRYKLNSTAIICLLGLGLMMVPFLARADLKCAGTALAEWLVPGLGYTINEDYDKALIFGGLRWWAINGYMQYSDSENLQVYPDEVFKESKNEDGEDVTDIYLSKETYYTMAYLRLYTNISLITIYDFYDGGCEDNTETYWEIFSPFQFWKFGDSYKFWIPTGIQLVTPGTPNLT
ncbi:MAG: hypothetical protein VXW41_06680, partial [SAR324 cluster bacterium]|nr:hypothetical protein [SAR324 cluster bacterium]